MRYAIILIFTVILTVVGCKAHNQQAMSVYQPATLSASVDYRGSAEDLPGAGTTGTIRSDASGGTAIEDVPQRLDDVAKPIKRVTDPDDVEPSTGWKYVGETMYNIFAFPFRRLSNSEKDVHCKRNWLGLKVSDIVSGVPAPADRMREIESLGNAAGKVDTQREENYIAALTAIIKSDPDANCRVVATKAIAKFKSSSADYGLNLALSDRETFVRIAACNAWATRPNPKAGAEALNTLLLAETDKDVTFAATKALKVCGTETSKEALNKMLDTADPALQVTAMEALGNIYDNPCRDVDQWRQFCRGEIQTPVEQEKKFSVSDLFHIWK